MSQGRDVLENISRETRLQEGIFFTQPGLVNEICSHFDFSYIESVLDSAAGSGNFLIPLAEKYPNIQFYGIEKNPEIYKSTRDIVDNYPNIHYFHGDCLLDSFAIPSCDLYLGNPPFANHSDLPSEYRNQLQPLWYSHLHIPKDFSLLLGRSRADIAQLVFQVTLERYLKPEAQIGVVLPDSLLWGKAAAMGFQKTLGFAVEKLVEIPEAKAFEGTRRSSFYVIARKGGKTRYPIPLQDRDGREGSVELRQGHWQLSFDRPHHWPENWLGYYRARQGINTLGANQLFFFHEKPEIEEELIYPLLGSSDIKAWRSEPGRWCMLPYKEGRILSPQRLESDYPLSWRYLLSKKDKLQARKSRFAQKNWYGLFGIGDYTFAPYRVTWRALGAKKMQAAMVTRGIPNQALHGYISLENRDEAYYLTALLNSSLIGKELMQHSRSGSKSFGQPGIIKRIPLPPFDRKNPLHLNIALESEALHKELDPSKEQTLDKQIEQWLLDSVLT